MRFYEVKFWGHIEVTCECCMEAGYVERRAEGFRNHSPYADAECANCERRQRGARVPEPVAAPIEIDPRPGKYYVSAADNGRVLGFLAGPFATHVEALAQVDTEKQRAIAASPRAHWYAYGTCRVSE